MDSKLVYVKTSSGDEAVRQSTRVVQRNLRMMLVLIDGKLSVGDLAEKIGNARMVEGALRELEEGGFIAPTMSGGSVIEEKRREAKKPQVSAVSQFSTLAPKTVVPFDVSDTSSVSSNFSSFGKPIFPTSRNGDSELLRGRSRVRADREDEYEEKNEPRSRAKIIFGSIAAIVLTLVGLAIFYPYERFKPAIEASASRLLQMPVHIGNLSLTLLPWPQLKLMDISIGEAPESRIEELRIPSPYALLGSGPRLISRIDVSGADVSANRLLSLPMFKLPVAGAAGDVQIRQIRIERSQVTVRDLALRDISGDIFFKPDGSVEKSSFQAVDRTIRLDATPTAQGILLKIDGMGWKPAGALVSFDSLQAKGLLQNDRLMIQSLDTTFLGGILKGSWLLDWSNGLAMSGEGTLSHLDSRRVSAAFVPSLNLEADLAGNLHLRGSGRAWDGLWQSVEATLDLDLTRGVLHGIDLGEAVRRGAGSVVRSGSTKFDRLRVSIAVNPRQVSGRNVLMDAGLVSASGQFVVSRERQVDGNLSVSMQTSASNLRLPVRISGTLPELSAVSGK